MHRREADGLPNAPRSAPTRSGLCSSGETPPSNLAFTGPKQERADSRGRGSKPSELAAMAPTLIGALVVTARRQDACVTQPPSPGGDRAAHVAVARRLRRYAH